MVKKARHEMERLETLNRANNWEFNEWFHGRSGRPMGMPGQSWNVGMFLLAATSFEKELPLF